MRIGNNISAMNTLNRLSVNNSQLSKSLEKLSSGSAINRAADDAAGLAISEKMRAQIAGLEQASKNAQDGISLVQTAEGALDQTHTALRRMETLAMKATNGTITAEDRAKIQAEVDARINEIDRVAETSNFNGIKLFDGSLGGGAGAVKIVASAAASGTALKHGGMSFTGGAEGVEIAFATIDGANKTDSTAAWSGKKLTISLAVDVTGGGAAVSYTQDDIQALIDKATGTVPTGTKLKVAVAGDGTVTTDTTASTKTDETAKFEDFIAATGSVTINGSTVTATSDGGGLANGTTITFANAASDATAAWANGNLTITLDTRKTSYSESDINNLIKNATGTRPDAAEGLKVSLSKNLASAGAAGTATLANGQGLKSGGLELQIGATSDDADKISVQIGKMDASSLLGVAHLDMSTPDAANAAIDKINAAIEQVSVQRANLGAVQNRLEQTIENLSTTAENMSAAESRIRDVDMAKQMTEFTKYSILSQASQAMLAQANSLPQGVLQLLK